MLLQRLLEITKTIIEINCTNLQEYLGVLFVTEIIFAEYQITQWALLPGTH